MLYGGRSRIHGSRVSFHERKRRPTLVVHTPTSSKCFRNGLHSNFVPVLRETSFFFLSSFCWGRAGFLYTQNSIDCIFFWQHNSVYGYFFTHSEHALFVSLLFTCIWHAMKDSALMLQR